MVTGIFENGEILTFFGKELSFGAKQNAECYIMDIVRMEELLEGM